MIKRVFLEVNNRKAEENNCLKSFIDKDVFKGEVSHLRENTAVEEIILTGNEPLSHPDILEMISYCHELGLKVTLYTSGIKRKEENSNINLSDSYLSLSNGDIIRLEASGLDKIVFDSEMLQDEKDRQLTSDSEILSCVQMSIIRASHAEIETDVRFVPFKQNYRELLDMVRLLNTAGLKNLSVVSAIPWIKEDRMLSQTDLESFEALLYLANKKFEGTLNVGIPLVNLASDALTDISVSMDGAVSKCPLIKEYDAKVLENFDLDFVTIYSNLVSIGDNCSPVSIGKIHHLTSVKN